MKNKVIKIVNCIFVVVLAVLLCVITFFSTANATVARADETTSYSNVLDDLQTDESFNMDDYPSASEDYSLDIIQIAESSDGELFIYVYRPYTGGVYDLTATSLNMSLFEWNTEDTKYLVYTLTLLNEYGVFQKYKVDGFTVSTDSIRYYDISAVYRAFDSELDEEANNDNTTDEVAFEVGKCWCADTDDSGVVTYSMQKTDTLEITSKFVGYVEYTSGFSLYGSWCYSHFVAFDCDYDIDYLYEADVYYISRSYSYSTGLGLSGEKSYSEETDGYAYLTYTDVVTYTGSGWLADTYTWNRIEKVSDFIADEDYTITDYGAENTDDIADMQWVLRFVETEVYATTGVSSYTEYGTDISNVTILRLKFKSNGITYNLGVVDNRTSGSDDPYGIAGGLQDILSSIEEFWETFMQVIFIIIGVVLLGLLLNFVTPVMTILKYLFKGIVYVISLPFKLIKNLFKRDG